MSIRIKLLITFMAIAIIPMLLVSALSFYGAQKSLREASLNDLRSLAAAKKIAVLEYLSGKRAGLLISPQTALSATRLSSSPNPLIAKKNTSRGS